MSRQNFAMFAAIAALVLGPTASLARSGDDLTQSNRSSIGHSSSSQGVQHRSTHHRERHKREKHHRTKHHKVHGSSSSSLSSASSLSSSSSMGGRSSMR